MMNAFTTAITEAAQRELGDVVQRLAKRYNFNYLEAMRMLDNDEISPTKNATPLKMTEKPNTPEPVVEDKPKTPEPVVEEKSKTTEPVVEEKSKPKTSKKKETKKVSDKPKYVKPKHPLPWTGKAVDTWCSGLRPNHGMLSQCTQAPKTDGLCLTCFKQMQTNGKTKCGTVQDRIAADDAGIIYKNPETGKAAVKIGAVLSKMKITKEDAVAEAAKFGIEIPDSDFDTVKKTKGRPPSERPKNKGEDKLDAMIAKAVSAVSSTSESESDSENKVQETEDVPPPLEEVEEPAPESVSVYDAETDDDNDEEDAVQVMPFEHDGVKYYRDTNNILYDTTTQDAVGVWNAETNTITPCSPVTDEEDA